MLNKALQLQRREEGGKAWVKGWRRLTSGVTGLFDLTPAVQLQVPDHQEVLAVTADFMVGSCNTNR